MTWPCPSPEFTFDGHVWSACVHCRRLAWSHEQADPMADITRTARALEAGGYDPSELPPTMRQ